MARKKSVPVIALDIETEKAQYGYRPEPICVCLVSDDLHISEQFWGADCITQSHAYLAGIKKKCLIIAHNGGKFDFGFYEHDIGKLRVIGSRLLSSHIGGHETLDTFLLMPTALKNLGSKGETDLDTHRLDCTDAEREKILEYCTQDCRVLLAAYKRFCKVFTGDENTRCKDTAAGNAFAELKKTLPDAHPTLWRTTGVFDATFRPYYHGGIVNTFGKPRDITGAFTMVDANSMYPGAMRNFQHPANNRSIKVETPVLTRDGKLKGFTRGMFFIRFKGWAKLLPHVALKGGLEYDVTGEYFVTSHELQAAIRTRTVRVDEIIEAYVFYETMNFAEFVDKYYELRQEKKREDNPEEYVYKIVLNSAYGKFGQDPRNYSQIASTDDGQPPEQAENCTEWKRTGYCAETNTYFWECEKILDEDERNFVNVAVAASITGAARATLIDDIGAVVSDGGTVHYCDTDSIVFAGRPTMDLGDQLGQWKVECHLKRLVIAAPKLYALEFAQPMKGKGWKVASKGVRATSQDVIDLVAGERDIVYRPDVGSHDYQGRYRTVGRTIKRETLGIQPV